MKSSTLNCSGRKDNVSEAKSGEIIDFKELRKVFRRWLKPDFTILKKSFSSQSSFSLLFRMSRIENLFSHGEKVLDVVKCLQEYA